MVFRCVERPILSASPFFNDCEFDTHGPGFASLPASCPESTNITAQAQSVLEGILKCYDLRFYGLRTYLQKKGNNHPPRKDLHSPPRLELLPS